MGQFNWWRRGYLKRKPLKVSRYKNGKSPLLQKIEHGDFELSDFYKLIRNEGIQLVRGKKAIEEKHKNTSQDFIRHKVRQFEVTEQKRINKLWEDYNKDEWTMISTLKTALIKEFEVDVFDEALETMKGHTVKDLYKQYCKLAA